TASQVDLGSISGKLLLSPGGTPLSTRPTLRLINVQLQGGPSGSVGQDPALDDPGLVAVNAAFNAGIDPTALGDGLAGGAIFSSEDNAALKNLAPNVQDTITSQAPPSSFFTTLQPVVIATVVPDGSGRFSITSVPPGLYALTPTVSQNGPFADLLFMRIEPGATTSVEMAFHPNP
ncbi:MAG: hypothetical protein M3Y56_05905, partial [Armatimonadota bacterium]|nr:hypothetical protein [Armatimonadota bacterium]